MTGRAGASAPALPASEWPQLLPAALHHRIVPTVAEALGGLSGVPAEVAAALHEAHVDCVTRSLRLVAAVSSLAEVVDAAAGRWALVKGVALAARYHGSAEARQTSDVDLLVPQERFVRVVDALTQQGLLTAPGWRLALGRGQGEIPLRASASVTVDLHWSQLHGESARRAFRLPTGELLDRTELVELAPNLTVPTTDTADTLLHLAYHTAWGGAERLGQLDDICRVAAQVDDWDEVVRRARERGLALLLAQMLRRSARALRSPTAPSAVLNALDGRSLWRRVHAAVDRIRPPEASYGRSGHGRAVVAATRDSTVASLEALARQAAVEVRDGVRGQPRFADTRFADGIRPRVLMLSLEPWDDVWRRNQHLVTALVDDRFVDHVTFVEPAVRRGEVVERQINSFVTAVRPVKPIPDRLGGKQWVARWIRTHLLGDVDLLWVNDARLGRWILHPAVPALYDVTDDWRHIPQPPQATRALVAAEDVLAREARTVVCSPELARRWQSRYGVDAAVVPNAVERRAWGLRVPVELSGPGPHAMYVGSLHRDRLDLDLLEALASTPSVGTVHLVGPNMLVAEDASRLERAGVRIHPPVKPYEVPGWMSAADVLVLPHRVDAFTLSLDAIKSHEYIAAKRPVVATPTSGFQDLRESGMCVADRGEFVARLTEVLAGERLAVATVEPAYWSERAAAVYSVLVDAVERGARPQDLPGD